MRKFVKSIHEKNKGVISYPVPCSQSLKGLSVGVIRQDLIIGSSRQRFSRNDEIQYAKGKTSIWPKVFQFLGFVNNTFQAAGDYKTYTPLWLEQAVQIGLRSLPLILYVSMFTGMVLSLQAVHQLFDTVPHYLTGTTVSKLALQEFSSVITGLVLSGRIGASMAAELGTMRVTEQIDALESMGYSKEAYLVIPRLLASAVVMPVLSIFSAFTAIIAGWLTAICMTSMSSFEFFKGVRYMAENIDFILPIVKSLLFGQAITLIACYHGLFAEKGARGVGLAATQAAVHSCVGILTLDFVVGWVLL